MYSIVIIVNDIVLYMRREVAKRLDLKCSHHIKRNDNCEVMDMLINLIAAVIL